MPLQKQVVEFPFGGLDQKKHAIFKQNGMLETATNVVYDKQGELQKRRGYDKVTDSSGAIFGETVDACFHGLAVFQGELLAFGIDQVYAIVDKDATRGIVRRGPSLRGAIRRTHYATAAMSAL